jgi:hypothetical protein
MDRQVAVTANPKETFEWETPERVQPGDVVELTWSLEGISAVSYRVAKVKMVIEDPDVIWSKLTVNNRRLRLFDTGLEEINGLPVEQGIAPPLADGLQNGSFELLRADNTALHWVVATVGAGVGSVDTTTAADGRNSFHFYTPSPSDEVLLTSDPFALRYLDGADAGALVYLDLKMKRGSHNVNSIDIYVDWYDDTFTLVDTETVVSGLNLLATWSSYHYDLPWPGSSPENVTTAVLRFHSQPMSGAYDWWIDSLQVAQPITPQRMIATVTNYGLHLPFDSGGGALAPFSLPAVRIPVASTITATHLLTQHGETMTAAVGIWVNASQWPTVADLVTTLSMSATDHYNNTGLSIAVTAGSWLIASLNSISGSSVSQLSAALDLKKA